MGLVFGGVLFSNDITLCPVVSDKVTTMSSCIPEKTCLKSLEPVHCYVVVQFMVLMWVRIPHRLFMVIQCNGREAVINS